MNNYLFEHIFAFIIWPNTIFWHCIAPLKCILLLFVSVLNSERYKYQLSQLSGYNLSNRRGKSKTKQQQNKLFLSLSSLWIQTNVAKINVLI